MDPHLVKIDKTQNHEKTLANALCLVLGAGAFGQINEGDWQLGDSVNFSAANQDNFDRSRVNITLRIGQFFSQTVCAGLQVAYTDHTFDAFNPHNGNLEEFNSTSLQIGAYVRLYKEVSDNLYLFLQPSFSYGGGNNEQGGTEVSDYNIFQVGASLG